MRTKTRIPNRGRIVAGSNAQEPRPSITKPKRNAPQIKGRPHPQPNTQVNKSKNNKSNKPNRTKPPGLPIKEARQLVAGEIRSGLNDIRKDRRQLRRESQTDRERVNTLYDRSVGDINHVFQESGDYIGHQNDLIQGLYGDQRTRTEAAQQALLGSLQGQNQQSLGAVSNELGRLGIDMNNAGDQNRMLADQGFGMNIAHQTGANNMANIDAQAMGASSIGNLLSGMNAGSRASRLGGAVNDRNDAMFEIQQNQIDGNNKVREAMSDMRGQRGDLTRQLLDQLAQTKWAQFMDLQGLNLQKQQLNQSKPNRPSARRRSSSNKRSTRQSSSTYETTNSGRSTSGSSKGKSKKGPRGFYGSYNDSVLNNLG